MKLGDIARSDKKKHPTQLPFFFGFAGAMFIAMILFLWVAKGCPKWIRKVCPCCKKEEEGEISTDTPN